MAMPFRTLLATALTLICAQVGPGDAAPGETRVDAMTLLQGSYEITTRLELPHLERWAIDKTTTICLPGRAAARRIPIPILSTNNPYAACAAANLVIDNGRFEYDVVCPGRDAAKAHAVYSVGAEGFAGRVAMVMGGKNMTMTEVQRARRVGDCSAETATEF